MVKEIEADAKQFADARRTLIQADKRAVVEVRVVDEPVTVVVSQKGWVRAQKGWAKERGALGSAAQATSPTAAASPSASTATEYSFKAGDALYATFECRSVDTLLVFGSNGRVYSVPVASLPGGRGDGQPITTLLELESGTQLLHYFAGPANACLLLSSSAGYGFLATVDNMLSRQRAGKAYITLGDGETVLQPSPVSGINSASAVTATGTPALINPATHVACATTGGRFLTFDIAEIKPLPKGGRGLMLMALDDKDTLVGAAAYTRSVRVSGIGRGGKDREEVLEVRTLNNARTPRARKGRAADLGFKPNALTRVE
jgi:topoisomerase-4 subunit A